MNLDPPAPFLLRDARPLDIMLYRPNGIFGRLIKFHTGYDLSHVEVFLGRDALGWSPKLLLELDAANGGTTSYSTASRDGKGVNFYPARLAELAYVLRPVTTLPLNVRAAIATAISMRGTPYGWLDLADFFGFRLNAKGVVCSPYATVIARAAGIPLFNGVQPRQVAPFMFRTESALRTVWTDGRDAAFDAEEV